MENKPMVSARRRIKWKQRDAERGGNHFTLRLQANIMAFVSSTVPSSARRSHHVIDCNPSPRHATPRHATPPLATPRHASPRLSSSFLHARSDPIDHGASGIRRRRRRDTQLGCQVPLPPLASNHGDTIRVDRRESEHDRGNVAPIVHRHTPFPGYTSGQAES